MRETRRNRSEERAIRSGAEQAGYSFVETFSGPGGLSLGLEAAGFDLAWAFDNNEWAVATHRERRRRYWKRLTQFIANSHPERLRPQLQLRPRPKAR